MNKIIEILSAAFVLIPIGLLVQSFRKISDDNGNESLGNILGVELTYYFIATASVLFLLLMFSLVFYWYKKQMNKLKVMRDSIKS